MTKPTTKPAAGDVGILGPCACGGGPTALNFECERCRLVYTVLLMRDVRAAQMDHYHDPNPMTAAAAKRTESMIDQAIAKLLTPPVAHQPDLDMQIGDNRPDYYTAGG